MEEPQPNRPAGYDYSPPDEQLHTPKQTQQFPFILTEGNVKQRPLFQYQVGGRLDGSPHARDKVSEGSYNYGDHTGALVSVEREVK